MNNLYNIEYLSNGDFLINPKASFELRLYNADFSVIKAFVDAMDEGINDFPQERINRMTKILSIHDIRCREIDEYIDSYKPIYNRIFDELYKDNHDKIQGLELEDREEYIVELREQAISLLEVRPDIDLVMMLFDNYPWSGDYIRDIFNKYDMEMIRTYKSYLYYKNKPIVVDSQNANRKYIDKMVEMGLAISGKDINIENLLLLLKVDQLKLIGKNIGLKLSKKKTDIINELSNSNLDVEQLYTQIDLDSTYQLVPLPEPYNQLPFDEIRSYNNYNNVIAEIISRTYIASYYSEKRHIDIDENDEFIKGYDVFIIDDNRCCPYCRSMEKHKYSKNSKPKIPFHLACRCGLICDV